MSTFIIILSLLLMTLKNQSLMNKDIAKLKISSFTRDQKMGDGTQGTFILLPPLRTTMQGGSLLLYGTDKSNDQQKLLGYQNCKWLLRCKAFDASLYVLGCAKPSNYAKDCNFIVYITQIYQVVVLVDIIQNRKNSGKLIFFLTLFQ